MSRKPRDRDLYSDRDPDMRSAEPVRRNERAVEPEDVRSSRLVLRAHPDLVEMLGEEARGNNLSRSVYVERILIGWLNRNKRRIDYRGRRVPAGSPPTAAAVADAGELRTRVERCTGDADDLRTSEQRTRRRRRVIRISR